MAKYGKEVTLAIAQYKTIKISVSDMDSFEDCDKAILAELARMPEVMELNEAEIKRVFYGKKK